MITTIKFIIPGISTDQVLQKYNTRYDQVILVQVARFTTEIPQMIYGRSKL